MFIIGAAVVIFSFLWFAANTLGGDMYSFIDFLSLLFILAPMVGVMAATGNFKVFYEGFRAVLFPKEEISEEMRGKAATLFRLLSKTAVIAGAMATFIGLINMLSSLDFSNLEDFNVLGGNIAASLITLIYGLVLMLAVFEPAVFVLKKRYTGKR